MEDSKTKGLAYISVSPDLLLKYNNFYSSLQAAMKEEMEGILIIISLICKIKNEKRT